MATVKTYVGWYYLPYDGGMYSDTAWWVSDMKHLEAFADFFFALDKPLPRPLHRSPSINDSYGEYRLDVNGERFGGGASFNVYNEKGVFMLEYQGYTDEFGSSEWRDWDDSRQISAYRKQLGGAYRLTEAQYEWFVEWIKPVMENRRDYNGSIGLSEGPRSERGR